jgi:hypothetical protein
MNNQITFGDFSQEEMSMFEQDKGVEIIYSQRGELSAPSVNINNSADDQPNTSNTGQVSNQTISELIERHRSTPPVITVPETDNSDPAQPTSAPTGSRSTSRSSRAEDHQSQVASTSEHRSRSKDDLLLNIPSTHSFLSINSSKESVSSKRGREETPSVQRSISFTKKQRQDRFMTNRSSVSETDISEPMTRLSFNDDEDSDPSNLKSKLDEIVSGFVIDKGITPVPNTPTGIQRTIINDDLTSSSLVKALDVKIEPILGGKFTLLSLQGKLDVNIYAPALEVWRHLRSLQAKKIFMELRTAFNTELLNNKIYPEWAVGYNPPLSLMTSTKSKQAVVNFRADQATKHILLANDLMQLESQRLSTEIDINLATLKSHYAREDAKEYKLQDALDSLGTLMQRAKDKEQASLQAKWNTMKAEPLKSLHANLAPVVTTTSDASAPKPTLNQVQQSLGPFRYPRPRPYQGRGRVRSQRGRGYTPAQQSVPRSAQGRGRGRGRGSYSRGNNNNFRANMKQIMEQLVSIL